MIKKVSIVFFLFGAFLLITKDVFAVSVKLTDRVIILQSSVLGDNDSKDGEQKKEEEQSF